MSEDNKNNQITTNSSAAAEELQELLSISEQSQELHHTLDGMQDAMADRVNAMRQENQELLQRLIMLEALSEQRQKQLNMLRALQSDLEREEREAATAGEEGGHVNGKEDEVNDEQEKENHVHQQQLPQQSAAVGDTATTEKAALAPEEVTAEGSSGDSEDHQPAPSTTGLSQENLAIQLRLIQLLRAMAVNDDGEDEFEDDGDEGKEQQDNPRSAGKIQEIDIDEEEKGKPSEESLSKSPAKVTKKKDVEDVNEAAVVEEEEGQEAEAEPEGEGEDLQYTIDEYTRRTVQLTELQAKLAQMYETLAELQQEQQQQQEQRTQELVALEGQKSPQQPQQTLPAQALLVVNDEQENNKLSKEEEKGVIHNLKEGTIQVSVQAQPKPAAVESLTTKGVVGDSSTGKDEPGDAEDELVGGDGDEDDDAEEGTDSATSAHLIALLQQLEDKVKFLECENRDLEDTARCLQQLSIQSKQAVKTLAEERGLSPRAFVNSLGVPNSEDLVLTDYDSEEDKENNLDDEDEAMIQKILDWELFVRLVEQSTQGKTTTATNSRPAEQKSQGEEDDGTPSSPLHKGPFDVVFVDVGYSQTPTPTMPASTQSAVPVVDVIKLCHRISLPVMMKPSTSSNNAEEEEEGKSQKVVGLDTLEFNNPTAFYVVNSKFDSSKKIDPVRNGFTYFRTTAATDGSGSLGEEKISLVSDLIELFIRFGDRIRYHFVLGDNYKEYIPLFVKAMKFQVTEVMIFRVVEDDFEEGPTSNKSSSGNPPASRYAVKATGSIFHSSGAKK